MSFSDLLTPRPEVLSDDGIAGIIDLANLSTTRKRRVPLEARPDDFFSLTYPTADIRRVVDRLGARFAGDDSVPGLFLFEGLKGSGKSHLLLLAYHLFANPEPAGQWLARHKLSCSLPPDAQVIINKFTDLPLTSIWDFIFEQVKEKRPERTTIQPSLAEVQEALAGRRLILIFDELEQGINVISDPALRQQNLAFLQMLSEWGNRSDQITLLASIYSDREEPGSTLLRVPAVRVHFSHDQDRARVAQHRLFADYENFDRNRAASIVDSYLALWGRHTTVQDSEQLRAGTLESFPFSPDLLDVLLRRVPARGGFQNLRGTLGFLAQLVKLHYQSVDLLTPAHASLTDQGVRTLLGDLDVSRDLIRRACGNLEELKAAPLATDISSAVMLYTLTGVGPTTGATMEELVRSVLRPGIDINTLQQTVETFRKYASYFHAQENRYFFDPEENADAKVEYQSLLVDDVLAREKLFAIWKEDVFRETGAAVIFKDVDSTKEACEALEKDRLRYVLAPRRLKPEERHGLYHGLSVRNQVILLEPRDGTFNLETNADLLKWAKRLITAQRMILATQDTSRRSQYERIAKEDKQHIANAIRRAGLVYVQFETFGARPEDDRVDELSLGNANSREDVLREIRENVYPVQWIEEHLGKRLDQIKGRTVGEIDREYRNTLGFPVPTLHDSIGRAIRLLCKASKIGVRHPRGNFCDEDPQLNESELAVAIVDDPFATSTGTTARQPAVPQPLPIGQTPDSAQPALVPTGVVETAVRREEIRVLPQLSAGSLRQELASKLQAATEPRILRVEFTIFLDQKAGDLSSYPAPLRGNMTGPGAISVEVRLTKEGEFTKGQVEQMAESLPAIGGAEYSARLEVVVQRDQTLEAQHA
jgi:hypothetical protein